MSIKSYIQGKRITHTYEIKENRDLNTEKFQRKPELITKDEIKWETLRKENDEEFVVDGEVGQTSRHHAYSGLLMFDMSHHINLSETEEVCVVDKIYRADIHAYMVHTDKVLSEEEAVGSADMKSYYDALVEEYNAQMISDDKKLEAYCKVHNLNPATTDYNELKKIVYANETIQGIKADYMLSGFCTGNIRITE